jgi:succinoglycan biosynthesis transport protein ExoP
MQRKAPTSIEDIVAVLQRRKYWLIIPAVLVTVLGFLLVPFVPRTYQSTATMLAQGIPVPNVYEKQSSSSNVDDQVQRIALRVLSSPDLAKMAAELNLYPKLLKEGKTGQIGALINKNLTIAPVQTAVPARGVVAFSISYVAASPQLAQQVTQRLAELFVKENIREGTQTTESASSFLDAQLAEAGRQLAEQQAKIQAFKSAHFGELPEQEAANLQMMSQIQSDLQTNAQALDQDNQQKVYLESVLNVDPTGKTDAAAPPAPLTPLQMELAEKQAELHADLLKYTPEHPDVIRLEHDIAALKVQIAQSPKNAPVLAAVPVTNAAAAAALPQAIGPSQTDLLRGQLMALNTEIKARQARARQLQQKLDQMQASAGTVPGVQTEYLSLNSAYEEMQKNYNLLLEKRQQAAMAADLNRNVAPEELSIVDPATLPTAPYKPDPALLYMGAVLLGVLAGFLFALVVELKDDTIHTPEEAADYLKLPVIISLPRCSSFAKDWEVPQSGAGAAAGNR